MRRCIARTRHPKINSNSTPANRSPRIRYNTNVAMPLNNAGAPRANKNITKTVNGLRCTNPTNESTIALKNPMPACAFSFDKGRKKYADFDLLLYF